MAMSANRLATEMEKIEPTIVEIEAARILAKAFATYFYDAMAGGVPVVPGTLVAAEAAMLGALTGMSVPGAGAVAIQSGITAFWGVVAASAAVVFPTMISATPPPTLAAIAAAIMGVAPANVSGNLPEKQAMKVVAGVIHLNNLGGTAALLVGPPVPIL